VYRLNRRATSLMQTSEIQIKLNLPLVILVLIFVNVKTLIILEQERATYMVLAAEVVPAATTLVTPALEAKRARK